MKHVLDSAIERSSERTQVLYVFRSDTAYKIGIATDPISKVQRDPRICGRGPSRVEVTFLVAVPTIRDGFSEERAVHAAFKEHRIGSDEWFRRTPEIDEWVRWLKHQIYALHTTEQADDFGLRAEVRKHADEWIPSPARKIKSAVDIEDEGALFPLARTLDDDLVGQPPKTENDYYTPRYVIDAARTVMGSIDTDPATHYEANKVIRAETCYTLQTNGLIREWKGNVWCNPPFAQWDRWVPKILSEYKSGRVSSICVLYHGKTEVNHCMSPLISAADAIWTPKGRIRFWGGRAEDAKSLSPMDGSKVAYLGPDPDSFAREFSKLGGSVKR